MNPAPRKTLRAGVGKAAIVLLWMMVQASLATQVHAAQMTEREKIDALLHDVEVRDDLRFVRLGSIHSSTEAAQMLRVKLRFAGSRVKTVNQFIDYIASATESGSPYYVIYPDGRQVPSRVFLREELKRLTQEPKATQAKR